MKKWNKEQLINREYLGVAQAAIYADRSVASVRQWIILKKIPVQKDEFGYRVMLKRSDIDIRLQEIEEYKNRGNKDETEELDIAKKDDK